MRKAVVIAFILASNLSFSQNYKFGKVSKEELKEKSYAEDPEANAAVLFKKEVIAYEYRQGDGFRQVREVQERIKIYNKDGFDWATKKVRLYDRSSTKSEDFLNLSAYTYTLEEGKIKKTKIKKESVFEEKNNKYWATKSFTMPNVKEGCVIEFRYRIESPYIQIDDIDLQYTIPIKKLDVEVKIPEFFVFNKQQNPKAIYFPKIEDTKVNRKETLTGKSRSVGSWGRVKSTRDYSDWEFKEFKTVVDETNVPALKKESFVRELDIYRAKLIWEYAAYNSPNNGIKNYSTNWEQVSKTINESESFGGQLEKTKYFESDVNALLEGIDDPTKRVALIYDFVRSKIKWNKYVGYRVNDGVKKAYKDRVGNVAEINLMLVAMLRYAGLNASPVLLSTRSNGIPLFPTTSGFNYVIAAIEVPDDVILLDGVNTYGASNILLEKTINWQGRIVRKQGSSAWIDLTPRKKSKSISLMNVSIADDLSISGKIKKHLTDYLALDYRERYYDSKNESMVSNHEKDKGDIEITNLDVKNKKELSKPINYTYDFKLDNAIEEIGDKLYMSPLLFLASEENPFKEENRIYPIDFIYPTYRKYAINLKIPEGYVVESLPENTKVQFNGTEGEFFYIVKAQGETIQVSVVMDLNKTLILPEEYLEFKRFFELSHEKQTEKIVLKKT